MSVINQMLKDLDQRQVEQNNVPNSGSITEVRVTKSNKTNVVVITLIVLIINVIGLYVWNLYQENQSFKLANENKELHDSLINSTVEVTQKGNTENKVVTSPKNNSQVILTANAEIKTPSKSELTISTELLNNNGVIESESSKVDKSQNVSKKEMKHRAPIIHKNTSRKVNISNQPPEMIQTVNTVITPIKPSNTVSYSSDELLEEPKNSSLSISRRKLSPEKLVQQKIKAAERAIIDNNISKAEQLFEEILLISPKHKSARKQLGALWFGRKLFRPAVNLLSRGIVIHPEDIDFRLMKARILLNQQNSQAAFNALNDFSTAKHVEYQVLLANTAQLLKRNSSAILAYQQLVDLEDYKGKWWLGLAVALDRNSEFDEAKSAYKNALTKHDLSENSAEFIRQRLNELGE